MHAGDGPGAEIGLGAAGTLHPAAFGRCPHPAGIPPGPTDAGVKVVRPRPPAPASWDGTGRAGGLRALLAEAVPLVTTCDEAMERLIGLRDPDDPGRGVFAPTLPKRPDSERL